MEFKEQRRLDLFLYTQPELSSCPGELVVKMVCFFLLRAKRGKFCWTRLLGRLSGEETKETKHQIKKKRRIRKYVLSKSIWVFILFPLTTSLGLYFTFFKEVESFSACFISSLLLCIQLGKTEWFSTINSRFKAAFALFHRTFRNASNSKQTNTFV